MSYAMKKYNFKNYYKRIQSAYDNRLNQFKPHIFKLTLLIMFFVFTFISLSVYLHPEGSRFSFHFFMEEGSISILSTTNLITASFFSFASFLIAPSEGKYRKIFFLVVTFALTYLALDEVFHFHETIGDSLDHTGFLKIIFAKTAIRRWNDLIIILYGVVALPVVFFFLPTVIQFPYVAENFLIAFLFYVAHTAIDAVVEPPTTPSYIIEESAKLLTSTFLALGSFAGWKFLINSRTKNS